MSNPQADTISKLYGKKISVDLVGEDENGNALSFPVKINRVPIRAFGEVVGIVSIFLKELGVAEDGRITLDLKDPGQILNLVSKLPQEVNKILGMLTSLSDEEVEVLELDHTCELLAKVLEVNKDFFIQKVKPRLDAVLKAAGAK